MKPSYPRIAVSLLALTFVIGLGACGRSQHVSDDIAGPGRHGAGTQVVAGCPTLVANTLATADAVNIESASVPQLRANRLRIMSIGDIAVPTIQSMGPCAAADIPTINFIGGHANVFVSGSTNSITTSGNRLTFGALTFAGNSVAPGTVAASDAEGNVLQIVWPQLAGVGVSSPRLIVQLARWNTAMTPPGTTLDVSFDFTVSQDGVQQSIKGQVANVPLDGSAVTPGGGSIAPCPTTLGAGGAVVDQLSGIVQFRSNRLRFEQHGDVAGGTIHASGACAAAAAPTIRYNGGSGNMFRAGTNISVTATGNPITFGPLLVPITLEPGVVLNIDAAGNVLEIIWPGLAGLPPGPPILRFQQTRWNAWLQTGRMVDYSMRFDAVGPDGLPASFTVAAKNVVIPQMR